MFVTTSACNNIKVALSHTQRDVFGNLLNSIVSIDASPFADNAQRQYETGSILRELNKAYVGFLCQQDRGDISTELLALGVKRGSLAFVEECYSDVEYNGGLTFSSKYGALGNVNISSSSLPPRITVAPVPIFVPTEVPVVGVPLSPIQEVSESSQMFDLASNIIHSGIKQATAESAGSDLAASILKSGIKQATAESAESDLAASILKSGIKQATAESAESDLAASILKSGIKQATAESAESDLAASILKSGIKQATAESAESDLAASILKSGIKQATAESAESDLAASILKSGIKQATAESAESDLAASILKSGIKQATAESAESDLAASILKSGIKQATAEVQQNGDRSSADESASVDDFASKLTSSLFDGAVTKATTIQTTPQITQNKKTASDDNVASPTSSAVDDVASALSSSILKSSLHDQPSSSATIKEFQAVADKLSESIISDVLSHDSPSTPHSVTTQTSGQPTSGSGDSVLESLADSISRDILSGAVTQSGIAPSPINRPAIYIQVERRGSGESGHSSRSSSITGQTITVHEFTDDLVESAVRDGIAIAQLTAQGRDLPPTEEHDLSSEPCHHHDDQVAFKHDLLCVRVEEFADIMTNQLIQEGLEQVRQDSVPPPSLASNPSITPPPKSFKQPPSLVRQKLTITSTTSSQRRHISEHHQDADLEQPVSNLLTTPSSSRMSYAWSTASTRDEDSRPVSPTELDRIGLSLTSDPDEFTSLLSKVVISDAIVMVTGMHSPRKQGMKEEGISMTNVPGCNSSWIDTFLSGLGEAETPDIESLTASNWHKMRKFLLRPVATGNWGCGVLKGDPQLKSMLLWAAVSASGRPQAIYCTSKNEALNQVGQACIINNFWKYYIYYLCLRTLHIVYRLTHKIIHIVCTCTHTAA